MDNCGILIKATAEYLTCITAFKLLQGTGVSTSSDASEPEGTRLAQARMGSLGNCAWVLCETWFPSLMTELSVYMHLLCKSQQASDKLKC